MSRSVVFVLVVSAGCLAPTDDTPSLSDGARAKAPDSLWDALADRKPHPIIVALDETVTTPRQATAADVKLAWAGHKHRLVGDVAEVAMSREWDELPLMLVEASSPEAAAALLDRDEIAAAFEPEAFETTDAQSFPLIDQPAAIAAGKSGSGTAVAVLDTGTDYTRAAFGSCTAPGVPASTCKVAVAMDFAPDDGSRDANGHGTNVSGIVLGVAPDTRILALDVFNGASAWNSDIITAINWVIAHRTTYNIAAMNLSLGGGSSTTPCASDAIGIALGTARAQGIAAAVASGNGALTTAISSPGCSPAAISVGAVYDSNLGGGVSYSNCSDASTAADKITCFSNSASFLTVLAPGAMITAADITMAGTSQASPHVAGTLAILHAAFPDETVDQLVSRLVSTGRPITDPRNGVIKPRIDVFAAVGLPAADTAPPTGTVAINGGAAGTRTAAVTLAIAATDASAVTQMCVTNTATCTAFVPFAATKTWTLAAGAGAKTVTVFLRDVVGNTTTADTSPKATIIVDATVPTNGTVTATAGNARVDLAWTGFADAGSGVASYKVVGAASATAPACTAAALSTGADRAFAHTGLVNGTKYSYRVCAIDAAGNMSTGAIASATPVAEKDPPVGTIVIDGGAAVTNTTTATLTLAATDATRVDKMCLSETTGCTAFVTYAATSTYHFSATNGTRTIRAWFRDPWGNTSAPVSASIVLDTVAPTGGVLSATVSGEHLTLTWTAATDATSGLDGYKLVGQAGATAPASCAAGTVLYAGSDRTFSQTIGSKKSWSYRLCAKDVAGNTSVGSVKTATTP